MVRKMLDFGQFDFGQFDFGQLAEVEIGRSRTDPKPQNPKPKTPNPEDLHPKDQNPKPCSLNPEPQTPKHLNTTNTAYVRFSTFNRPSCGASPGLKSKLAEVELAEFEKKNWPKSKLAEVNHDRR